jgi:hypothetical protein
MLRLVKPYLPRMRGIFLAKLAEADPAAMERVMGAFAVSIEQVLAEAPGEPLDRWRFVWIEGARMPELVPDVWSEPRRSPGVDTEELPGVDTGLEPVHPRTTDG